MGHCDGDETWKLCSATESCFDLSVSQHSMEFNQLHLEVVGALSTLTANGLLSSLNQHFWASKSANCRVNSLLKCAEFFSKLCTWKHLGRDLLFNILATRKMAQVSLQQLSLPQVQLGFKSPHRSVHVCDDTAPPLKLQVEHIEMAQDVLQKYQLTQKLFISELCCEFPFAFHKLTYFLT